MVGSIVFRRVALVLFIPLIATVVDWEEVKTYFLEKFI
jgi:hypothetical protein